MIKRLTFFSAVLTAALSIVAPLSRDGSGEAFAQSAAVDGSLVEWGLFDRLDLPPYQGGAGDELYARSDGSTYFFAIRSAAVQPGAKFTIWLNADKDAKSGFQIFGFAGGAEFNVTGTVGGVAALFRGAAGAELVAQGVITASGPGTLEIALPKAIIPGAPDALDVLVDVNSSRYIPEDYSLVQYRAPGSPRPVKNGPSHRVGIVYSDTTAKGFFDRKAYGLLYSSAQHQALMAGVPFDLLEEGDLLSLSKLVEYDTLIFPLFSYVPLAAHQEYRVNLREAVARYRIGIIASGDFITNDETGAVLPGDPYRATKDVFGIVPVAGQGPAPVTLRAGDVAHPIMRGYAAGEVIREYPVGWFRTFDPLPGISSRSIVTQDARGGTFTAALATVTGGRNVHFSTERVIGDTNVLWSAIRWTVFGEEPRAVIAPSRAAGLASLRFDAFSADGARAKSIEAVRNLMAPRGPATAFLRPADTSSAEVRSLQSAGFEAGLSPLTPPTTPPGEFESRLLSERLQLEKFSGRDVVTAELSDATTPFDQTVRFGTVFAALSGEPSVFGIGYPGAFGSLTAGSPLVYLAPNLRAGDDADLLVRRARRPIVHRVVPASELSAAPGDVASLLEGLSSRGFEFVSVGDVMARVRALRAAKLEGAVGADGVLRATVSGAGLGASALDTERAISSVDGWYAYDGSTVFLPENGGSFTIRFDGPPRSVVRVSSLSGALELLKLTGDGAQLAGAIRGTGEIRVSVPAAKGIGYRIQGTSDQRRDGDVVIGYVAGDAIHEFTVESSGCGDGRVFLGELCDDGNGNGGDGCSPACEVESGFACGGSPSICSASASSVRLPAIRGQSGWLSSDRPTVVAKRQSKEVRVGKDASGKVYRSILSFSREKFTGTVVSAKLVIPLRRPIAKKLAAAITAITVELADGSFGKTSALEARDYGSVATLRGAGSIKPLPAGASTLEIPLTAAAANLFSRGGTIQARLSASIKKSSAKGASALLKFPTGSEPRIEVSIR